MGNCYMATQIQPSISVDIKAPPNQNSNRRSKTNNNLKQSLKEEEKNIMPQEELQNNGEIHIKSKETCYPYSRIEAILPDPYAESESDKQIIKYTIKSKFKSRYADYINHKSTMESSKINNGLKVIKTYKNNVPAQFDSFIHFTNIHYNKSKRDYKTNIQKMNFGFNNKESDIIKEGIEESE